MENVKNTLSFCLRTYVLESDRVVREGTGRELLNNPHFQAAYLVL